MIFSISIFLLKNRVKPLELVDFFVRISCLHNIWYFLIKVEIEKYNINITYIIYPEMWILCHFIALNSLIKKYV